MARVDTRTSDFVRGFAMEQARSAVLGPVPRMCHTTRTIAVTQGRFDRLGAQLRSGGPAVRTARKQRVPSTIDLAVGRPTNTATP
jgi:hypothetical protein